MNRKNLNRIKYLSVLILLTFVIGFFNSSVSTTKAASISIPNLKTVGFLSGVGTANDVVFSPDGNKAYLASDPFGLVVIDTTDKINPKLFSEHSSQRPNGPASQLAVSGNTAVATGTPRGTDIIDISDPTLPKVMSSISGSSTDAAIKDNYAYIAAAGIVKIVNISNPAVPVESPNKINTGTGQSIPYGVSIIDNYAVIAAGSGGIAIFDITNPLNPIPKGVLALGTGSLAVKMATGNIGGKNYAFVANTGLGKLQVIDISNPDAPVKVTGGEYSTGSATNVTYKDSKAYVSTAGGKLYILNISAQGVPSYVSMINYGGNAGSVFGNYLYTANGSAGLSVIDITTPSSPSWKITLSSSTASSQLAISGNTAVAAGTPRGTDIIDISDPTLPKVMSSIAGSSVDTAIKDNYAYIAAGAIIKVVDISNPATASVKATINTASTAYGVSIIDNYLAIAAGSGGIVVADIANPLNPVLKTPLALGTGSLAVKIATGNIGGKNYAFVANTGLGKLQVIDISNTDALIKVGEYSSGAAINVIYKDNKVYISALSQGMHIVNVSTPSVPTLLGKSTVATQATEILGNYAFLAVGAQGITVVDISNPAIIRTINTYPQFGYVADVLMSGNKLFAADASAEIVINNIYNDEIKLTKSSSGNSVTLGGKVTYTIKMENASPNQLSNIVLTDPFPSNLSYVAGSATLNGNAVTDALGDDSFSSNSGIPTWTFSSLPATGQTGSTLTVTFQVKCDSQALIQSPIVSSKVNDTAIVSSGTPTPEPTPDTTNSVSPQTSASPSSNETPTTPAITTEPSDTITGLVTDSSNKKPVTEASVSLISMDGKVVSSKTDNKGKYSLAKNNLQLGQPYTLEIKKGSAYTAKTDLMLSAGNTSSQAITVKKNNIFTRIWIVIKGLFVKS